MIVIPAIDLKDGKCVRLRQGRMDSSTIFNDDPAAQARQWQDYGASRIHVVDLNGSIDGRPVNLQCIKDIVEAVNVPVQLGGGIRDKQTVRSYLEIGVGVVILGTAAVKEPEKTVEILTEFPGRIAIGIDAQSGNVAVQGWTESTDIKASRLAARFEAAGPVAFIYTDIERDGMMTGPNIHATRDFASGTSVPVILSGGVSAYADIIAALPLEKSGVIGIITGRALYEGAIDLREAIRIAENRDAR
ncbi:MAG: 1-(5-phosphoribosyl)-5-[(5-phosphoribosylamino)methylideneamino]imidazole-4-carboxamide isomerase [Desulfomonilaceae bacterium]|nr:1-(5-phosphoribosyl)-5-[(5-phosphoribosylamino)methylideneamino]imidazole-4-carboxamide isomerase [Desulfomonilaceae bacterium]